MPDLRFYPDQKNVMLNPTDPQGDLTYFLEGFEGEVEQNEMTLKYAFPARLDSASPDVKNKVRKILIDVLDISNFSVESDNGRAAIKVPTRQLTDESLLPDEESVKVPILVKLVKSATADSEQAEFKCQQELVLVIERDHSEDPGDVTFDDEEGQEESYEDTDSSYEQDDETEDGLEDTDENEDEEEEEVKEEERSEAGLYSGLVAIDYGTTNSAIVVRDPRFAAEEVRGQLSTEQWESLCEWVDTWLSTHLSKIETTDTDLFVENLTRIVPNADLPTCGTPEDEIRRSLVKIDDGIREQILRETICRLSNFSQEGTNAKILKEIAPEVMLGFESVIDSKSLESQRYFVLELDENAGPGPIPSALQVVSAPSTEDLNLLMEETKIDMGARVGLLLRSAASGGADIRQFVISIKRYFGRDEVIEVVPADNTTPIQFPADTLCRLAYRELLTRAVGDIHRRSENGQFQDADWPCSLVATFPTSYPASLRRSLKEILTDLNIKEIDTRFDEATAAAIYYIWREVGSDPVCGMNGLMARCRKDPNGRSYQNILLYDLGGGTTDIALIQLLYEELPIFEEGEDRGNGGRYFRITPRLLGTTGHRYIGGDLITLWLFRLIKAKLADCLLSIITEKNIEPPMDSELSQLLLNLSDQLVEEGADDEAPTHYRRGALLEWTLQPMQQMRTYNHLNETIIDPLVPTRFANDSSRIPNFFTLWETTEELKKTLGTPVVTDSGSGLAMDWPEETEIDSGQLFNLVQTAHPWLTDSGMVQQDDLRLSVTQEEMTLIAKDPIKQSLSLAVSLSKARLLTQDHRDRIDRLILSGQSCNMKAIQEVAMDVFRESDGVFDYDPANVRFDRDSAKTSVALGACIGRYLESVRIDPWNPKTREMLRDGYDQIELVIENLFTYLSCRLAYDSLVAMVTIFDQGHELNLRSFTDRRPVARTSINHLRPVQEKFWIYRIDFEGAEPQYLGLINAELVAKEYGFDDFRKFREEYLVGFEADAELFVRAFFLPKGLKTIKSDNFVDAENGGEYPELITSDGSFSVENNTIQDEEPQEEIQEDIEEETFEDEEEYMPAGDEDEYMPVGDEEDGDQEEIGLEDDFAEDESTDESEDEEVESEEEVPAKRKPRSYREAEEEEGPKYSLAQTVTSQEIFDRRATIVAGQRLQFQVEYPEGTFKCAISEPLPIREKYEFYVEQPTENGPFDQNQPVDENTAARFNLDEEETDEATLVCDERGKLRMLTGALYDIEIWADIEYVPQKMDIHYDPFCGHH
ncbi:hypothetical protein [Candidatus Uabimicrobium sp. HlEnr_7]|uniref:hypothetical protein n=1 Tax=Candidatus Uabimicrobium helgolandensis TaxID=3095367 RepID=UPI003558E1A4